ncbi:MAG TPA: RICIN domain-containing protein [Methylocella sp.]|nr:RICIN domain-containing protein [Methylocella sp.]
MRIAHMGVLSGCLLATTAPIYPTAQAALLYNNAAGLCLAVQNGQTANFTPVVLEPCPGAIPPQAYAQQWAVYGPAILAPGTLNQRQLCLDRYLAGTTVGTQVEIYPCNGTAAQNWFFNLSGQIQDPKSGLCLGLVPVLPNNVDQQLTMQPCGSDIFQQWSIN